MKTNTYPRLVQLLALGAVALTLLTVTSAQAASATWNGGTDGNWFTGANWSTSPTPPGATTGITNADVVTFNTNPAFTTLTIDVGRNFKSIVFDGASGSFTIGSAGANGGNSILLTNNGTNNTGFSLPSTFTASNTTQTINAPVVLEPATPTTAGNFGFLNSAGGTNVLKIAGNISGGTTTSTILLTLNGTNTIAVNELSGVISNGGAAGGLSITKVNNSSWFLSGTANTFTGGLIVNSGTLSVNTISNSGVVSSIGQGSTITIGVNSNPTTFKTVGAAGSTNRAITLVNGNTVNLDSSGTGAATYTGNITNQTSGGTAAVTLALTGTNTGANEVSGNITDGDATHTINLSKTAAGTWTISGNNTYSGNTTVSAGTLNLGSSTALSGGPLIISGGTVDNTSGAAFSKSVTSTTVNGNFAFTGTNSLDLGTNGVSFGTTAGTTRTLTVDGSTFGIGGIADGTTAKGLIKAGAGTLAINGNSSYTGTTVVNANGGTLLVNGAHTTAGAYTINSGGALGGLGSIATASNAGLTVAAGGKLSPGDATTPGAFTLNLGSGVLNISGAVTATNSQSLLFDLGSTSDSLVLSNASSSLNIGSGLLNFDDFNFTLNGGFTSGTYTLFDTANTITGSLGTNLTGLLGGYNASIQLSGNSQDVLLVVAVPEPSTYAMLVGGVVMLGLRIRRKHRI